MKKTIALSLLGIFFLSCLHKNPNKGKITTTEKAQIYKFDGNKSFKAWINDTLNELYVKKHIKLIYGDTSRLLTNNGIIKFFVYKDSTALSIKHFYNVAFTKENFKNYHNNSEYNKVISLLRSYKELPKVPFNLSFNTDDFFWKSDVGQLKYSFTKELDNIQLKSLDGSYVVKYSYNRGSLGAKTEYRKRFDRKQNKYLIVESDWDFLDTGPNNSLVKKLNNSRTYYAPVK